MADVFITDEEKYENDSFENESDNEIPEIYDSGSENGSRRCLETREKNNIYTYSRNVKSQGTCSNNDYVPYDSTSDDDDVIISQTIVEINSKPTMQNSVSIPAYQTNEFTFIAEDGNKMLKRHENRRNIKNNIIYDLTKPNKNDHIESDIILTSKMLETVMADESLLHSKQCEMKNCDEPNTEQYGNEHSEVTETDRTTDFDPDTEDDVHEPCIELCISRHTPTSCNTDEYALHMNILHKADSFEKLRLKNNTRKSWSFSNERMREIERQNQILLKKILTQKPTYSVKQKKSISNIQHTAMDGCTSCTRITSAAVNRKKQQRQIDLDNQVLKRKIEAISLRRPIL